MRPRRTLTRLALVTTLALAGASPSAEAPDRVTLDPERLRRALDESAEAYAESVLLGAAEVVPGRLEALRASATLKGNGWLGIGSTWFRVRDDHEDCVTFVEQAEVALSHRGERLVVSQRGVARIVVDGDVPGGTLELRVPFAVRYVFDPGRDRFEAQELPVRAPFAGMLPPFVLRWSGP